MELPRIHVDQLVRGLDRVQPHPSWNWHFRLIAIPGCNPRTRQICSSTHHLDSLRTKLAACTNVLHSESSMTKNNNCLPFNPCIVNIVENCIFTNSSELLLTFVHTSPRNCQIARVEGHACRWKGDLFLTGLSNWIFEACVVFHTVDDQIDGIILLRGPVLRCSLDDFHVCVHSVIRHDAKILSHLFEMSEKLVSTRPGRQVLRRRIVLVVLQVICPKLCLQFGSLVCLIYPGCTTDNVSAIEAYEVGLLGFDEPQSMPQTYVTCADDGVWVRVRHSLAFETWNALDDNFPCDFLMIILSSERTSALAHELHHVRVNAQPCAKQLFDFVDFRAGQNRDFDRLICTKDRELCLRWRQACRLSPISERLVHGECKINEALLRTPGHSCTAAEQLKL
mmetsp:Transcript_33702/g.62900  ORF Transcript_33702/g.62900 Transcript_33702/m.62900 type:complete len:394 (+) Transcript_33702:849-2030(+)